MFTMPSKEKILEKYHMAEEHILSFHLRPLQKNGDPVFLISSAYPGVWLEHAFDALCYANLYPSLPFSREIARNQMMLFLGNQKPDGHLPFNVMDERFLKEKNSHSPQVGYRQIQECVSFGRLCMETYTVLQDRAFLKEAYEKCALWDAWLCRNRMTMQTGLIELFCLFDTGHDNSGRLAGIPVQCPDADGKIPADHPDLPILAPDMNAVFYGDRMALADMAEELGDSAGAELWRSHAMDIRNKIFELLFDPADAFFCDRDCHGHMRFCRSIAVSNIFTEHLLTQSEFDEIYDRHFKNPQEFWTAYPFPSVSVGDPASANHAKNNCWGYYSQALTALRAMRWMDFYGKSDDYDFLLQRWVSALARQDDHFFTQELDPMTGEPTDCSEWYSSAMLLYLYAVRRLGYL